jgi:hypothetical protein
MSSSAKVKDFINLPEQAIGHDHELTLVHEMNRTAAMIPRRETNI